MITEEQAAKLLALAAVYRTRAVRQFAASRGIGGPRETVAKTASNYERARSELVDYINSLKVTS